MEIRRCSPSVAKLLAADLWLTPRLGSMVKVQKHKSGKLPFGFEPLTPEVDGTR